ncbi:MAG: phosphotransferase family protein [Gammaproteobacteria bacterium]
MKDNVLVCRPDDLTAGWAQRIIRKHHMNARVSCVKIVSIDIGTTTRIRLEVKHDAPSDFPQRWFVKIPSLNWRARSITALPRLLHMEVRFYNEISRFIPVKRPDTLAAHSALGLGTTLVLNDVTEFGAKPGSAKDALTAGQGLMVIKQLARLHAHFWNKTHLDPNFRWLSGSVRTLEDCLGTALAVPLMKRGLSKAGSLVPKALHAPALRYARQRRLAMRELGSGPLTLVHHDCHPGNLFWNNSHPGFLDWQLVRIGEGIGDVAYFLATALSPETRRLHEPELLARYCQLLGDHGVPGMNPRHLLHRYRAHLVYAFEAMVVTLAVSGLMDLESNLELIRRTAAAVEDSDSFSALPI